MIWADGGGAGGKEDTAELVDIWLSAKQYDPPAWVEIPALEVLIFSSKTLAIHGGT